MAQRSKSKKSRKSSTTKKRRTSTTRSKSSTRKSTNRKSQKRKLTFNRRLDIAGVLLAFIGALTLVSVFSKDSSRWMEIWVGWLLDVFGWGIYVIPTALTIFGIWLVLRNVKKFPRLSFERFIGLVLLSGNILAVMHLVANLQNKNSGVNFIEEGIGGGYSGQFLFGGLQNALGLGGSIIALIAWFLIALALTLNVSVLELFRWIPPIVLKIQDWLDERAEKRRTKKRTKPILTEQTITATAKAPDVLQPERQTEVISPQDWETSKPTWSLPPIDKILDFGEIATIDEDYDAKRGRIIEETLESFGAPGHIVEINRGPTITQYGVEPDYIQTRTKRTRVRVNKITALRDDLALALAATRIRIQAPVPGKGYIGIEVPNEEISLVALRDVLESPAFERLAGKPLRFALGQDVSGNAVATDLARMPHLLVAGTTGSGKSVCVNAMISCLLINNTPDDLRMIMVDPKRVELSGYDGIPHLLAPVIVDLEKVVGALQWVLREMDGRYHKFAKAGTRNIAEYNKTLITNGDKKLPYLVVVIDELADLMMLAPDETEKSITRLAQLARATGIHMIISTQRPSVDVVTGLIKANFPSRIAFNVASGTDSRVIIDQSGAERLLGRGDMLFLAPDSPAPVRLQGVFVSDSEIMKLVQYWRKIADYKPLSTQGTAAGGIPGVGQPTDGFTQVPLWDDVKEDKDRDPIFNEAVKLVRDRGRASISMLQRRLRIGYTRSARLIENMEDMGIVGPAKGGSHARDVLPVQESEEE